MQRPTLENVRIRSTRDALHVFNAVARSVLPLITRRLDADERRAITSGNVYVWEERGANTETIGIGMERWTDGMGWGPSRVRDEFLFYNQKESDLDEAALSQTTPWAMLMRKPGLVGEGLAPSVRSRDQERLVKQTYSVHVSLPADRPRGIVRKWHITAYFSPEKLDSLHTIDSIRGVGDVPVPEGLFRSARAGKTRRDSREVTGYSRPPPEIAIRPAPPLNPNQHPAEFFLRPRQAITPASSDRMPASPSPGSLSPNRDYFGRHPSTSRLVPLDYLENIAAPKRDAADEQLLRRFSISHSSTSAPVHQNYYVSR